jgi:hypothetical protein
METVTVVNHPSLNWSWSSYSIPSRCSGRGDKCSLSRSARGGRSR